MMFLLSVLFHLIDDFVLQMGCLNKLKQKQWWIKECEKENVDYRFYEDDYLVALFLHGLEWSIMISLPFIYLIWIGEWNNNNTIVIMIIINAFIHAIIDHLKANLFKINLLTDQLFHIFQILLLYFIVYNF